MKKLSLILASVALFATVANAQTDSSKSASATTETKTETVATKAKKGNKAKLLQLMLK